LALTQQEIDPLREKLEIAKEKTLRWNKFPSLVNQVLEALEKDLSGYDPAFAEEILRQLVEVMDRIDINDALKLSFARSILRAVKSGDPMEMLLVTEMITVHDAKMNIARCLKNSKTLDEIDSYGNIFNKLARTFATQMDTLQRWRSGTEQKVTVQNVSVSDGGQAIVGNVTQNGGSGRTDIAKPPLALTDQSGTAMPVIQPDEQSDATVPRIEQNEQPTPTASRRKRRA
jgi:hypothetical protein